MNGLFVTEKGGFCLNLVSLVQSSGWHVYRKGNNRLF